VDSTLEPAALAALLAAGPAPVLLDVRWRLGGPPGLDRYREGHLPGARFVDLDRDLAGPPGAGGPGRPGGPAESGGRHPLPSAEAFQAAMRRAGVDDGWPVLVYDENDSVAAARAWWLLRYFGHQQVQVLDGGYQAWVAADEPIETGPAPAPAPGTFTARPGHLPLLDAAGAARVAREGVLLDARAAERYRGEVEPVDPVAGHIPDAVSAPTTGNLSPGGRFLDPEVLRARFAGLGVPAPPAGAPGGAAPGGGAPGGGVPPGAGPGDGAVRTGVYCGSGVTAAHEVLALSLAGIPAALYVGSWSDWITDPARPVVTGAAPR
jgi:thiosulfate/3-mercaptopyruvate sulfurtransferase